MLLSDKKLAIGWLNELDSTNLQALVLCQNMTDHDATEYNFIRGIPGYYDVSMDGLLQQLANTHHDYVMILAVGTRLSDSFISVLNDELKSFENVAFAAHILDKKDRYYKLYPQALLVNLAWFRKHKPEFGKSENITWLTTEIERSSENYHSDYTPLWIKKGSQDKEYTGREYGWNFLKVALDSGYEVRTFSHALRSSKEYFYPEDQCEWSQNLVRIWNQGRIEQHYISNTEEKLVCPPELFGTIDRCAVPASGMNALFIPWLLGMPKESNVLLYDISYPALKTSEELYEHFRGDVNKFVQNHVYPKFDSSYFERFFCDFDTVKLQHSINEEIDKGFGVWLKEVFPTLKYKFCYMDIFDSTTWYNLVDIGETRGFLCLSNILHYFPTAIRMPLKDRINLANDFFTAFKDRVPEWYIDYRGFSSTQREIIKASDIPLQTMPESLKFLPWNR